MPFILPLATVLTAVLSIKTLELGKGTNMVKQLWTLHFLSYLKPNH